MSDSKQLFVPDTSNIQSAPVTCGEMSYPCRIPFDERTEIVQQDPPRLDRNHKKNKQILQTNSSKHTDKQDELAADRNCTSYHDYSSSSVTLDDIHDPSTFLFCAGSDKKNQPFPVVLHQILCQKEFQDIICWLPHGRSWRVIDQNKFEKSIIPKYFRHGKYASFKRQVNGWGFHRVYQGPDRNSYYHELFLRGLPHLCFKMRRPEKNEVNRDKKPRDAPNFYKISEEFPLPEYAHAAKSCQTKRTDETKPTNYNSIGTSQDGTKQNGFASLKPKPATNECILSKAGYDSMKRAPLGGALPNRPSATLTQSINGINQLSQIASNECNWGESQISKPGPGSISPVLRSQKPVRYDDFTSTNFYASPFYNLPMMTPLINSVNASSHCNDANPYSVEVEPLHSLMTQSLDHSSRHPLHQHPLEIYQTHYHNKFPTIQNTGMLDRSNDIERLKHALAQSERDNILTSMALQAILASLQRQQNGEPVTYDL